MLYLFKKQLLAIGSALASSQNCCCCWCDPTKNQIRHISRPAIIYNTFEFFVNGISDYKDFEYRFAFLSSGLRHVGDVSFLQNPTNLIGYSNDYYVDSYPEIRCDDEKQLVVAISFTTRAFFLFDLAGGPIDVGVGFLIPGGGTVVREFQQTETKFFRFNVSLPQPIIDAEPIDIPPIIIQKYLTPSNNPPQGLARHLLNAQAVIPVGGDINDAFFLYPFIENQTVITPVCPTTDQPFFDQCVQDVSIPIRIDWNSLNIRTSCKISCGVGNKFNPILEDCPRNNSSSTDPNLIVCRPGCECTPLLEMEGNQLIVDDKFFSQCKLPY
jgi:hypothetical protein